MNRRSFLNYLTAGTVAAMAGKVASSNSAETSQVAITVDDPNSNETPGLSAQKRNQHILEALNQHSRLKAALFVCGMRVDDETGRRILKSWDDQGHIIANHSYSHPYYHSDKISVEAFMEEITRGEIAIKGYENFEKIFRFPYLKEGNTVEKRDRMREFLKARRYRNGYVTIDASDWYIDERLRKRLSQKPDANVTEYRDFYLKHIGERAAFYDGLARKVLGRSIRHTLLLHHNLLNALFLKDLLRMFQRNGWKLINAGDAFKDEVSSMAPNILPMGESIVWALAKETGKFDSLLRYPGEDSRYEKAEMDRLGL